MEQYRTSEIGVYIPCKPWLNEHMKHIINITDFPFCESWDFADTIEVINLPPLALSSHPEFLLLGSSSLSFSFDSLSFSLSFSGSPFSSLSSFLSLSLKSPFLSVSSFSSLCFLSGFSFPCLFRPSFRFQLPLFCLF